MKQEEEDSVVIPMEVAMEMEAMDMEGMDMEAMEAMEDSAVDLASVEAHPMVSLQNFI